MADLRGSVSYLIAGNKWAPRAHTVKLYCADGTKDFAIPQTGSVKKQVETVLEIAPARAEAYDSKAKLLRSLDLTKLVDPDAPEAGDSASETTVHVTREERLLSHFAKLLTERSKDSDAMVSRAFKAIVQIAEHHARTANALEQRNATLQNALIKQSAALVQAQVNAIVAAKGGGDDDGDDAISALVRAAIEKQAGGGDAKPNGSGGTS